ncbi:carbohydrate ABC transporter permease [Ruminococcaceae bacterium OttesenSCG-928-L11]|nr:carbohydrate ABC transporter permease [Ruminococcaceae bacterium OttesenSCG-928-L11]
MTTASKPNNRIRASWDNTIFHIINTVFLVLMILVVIFPLLYVISMSLSSVEAVSTGKVYLFPVDITLQAYRTIATTKSILVGMSNTVFYAVVGTLLNVTLTILCAYPLSRNNLPGRKFLLWIFTFTMMFGGGMIPTYLTVRSLGLINTRAALIIPSAMNVWNMVIARTFFINTIPDELIEAAEIDGAHDGQVFFRIVIPNSVTILAVISLFYAVGHWNQYFDAMIYLNKPELYNPQLVLRTIIASTQAMLEQTGSLIDAAKAADQAEVLKYAVIVFASLPIMIVYPFIQRFFIKGVMVGSLKG